MNFLKVWALRVLQRVLRAQPVRELLWQETKDVFSQPRSRALELPRYVPLPPRFARGEVVEEMVPAEKAPIFVTARFRSGSTFLWQLFRNTPGLTAYYEPLNENRWFVAAGRHVVDATHKGVADYRREYAGMDDLDGIFKTEWTYRQLYMDQRSHDESLHRYIAELIRRSPGRPVLQFNRVDFRLPWLRAQFPAARIVHLYRDPREQWMSVVMKMDAPIPPKMGLPLSAFNDPFYTLEWARDLRHVFPFLEPAEASHPYELHYYLWRLSYLFGKQWADCSLSYEDLIGDVEGQLGALYRVLGVEDAHVPELAALNKGVIEQRWQSYASAEWFFSIERHCERVLTAFFSDLAPDTGKTN